MLAHKRAASADPRANENGLAGVRGLSRAATGLKSSASIRDKISQWEGKKESAPAASPPPTCPPATAKEAEPAGKKDPRISEPPREESKRLVSWERQDSGKENSGKLGDSRPASPAGPGRDREGLRGKPAENAQDKSSVLTHIKKLEQAMKESPSKSSIVLPGNYFCPPSRGEDEDGAEVKGSEPIFGILEVGRPAGERRRRDAENVYSEPGAPSINPLPKPQRTFQHHTPDKTSNSAPGPGRARRNLPPLPSIPPPPLPTCPPPGVNRRPWSDRSRDSSNR